MILANTKEFDREHWCQATVIRYSQKLHYCRPDPEATALYFFVNNCNKGCNVAILNALQIPFNGRSHWFALQLI